VRSDDWGEATQPVRRLFRPNGLDEAAKTCENLPDALAETVRELENRGSTMREPKRVSVADFLENPQQLAILSQRFPPPDHLRTVQTALKDRWPELVIHISRSTQEFANQLREYKPQHLVVLSGGDVDRDLVLLSKIESQIEHEAMALLINDSGQVFRLELIPGRDISEKPCGDQVIATIEEWERMRGKLRYQSFRYDYLKRSNQRLKQLSLEDPLTGLLNRRGFFRFLRLEWARAMRYESDVACVIVDLDSFKSLNDTYGHPIGDWMLRRFAEALRSNCRTSDIIGRIGGDEFSIIMPNCNEHQAILWAEKTRDRIAGMVVYAGRKPLKMTGSFGVSACQAGVLDEHELLERADQAILMAKHGGRNRVVPASALTGYKAKGDQITGSNRVVRLLLDSLGIRDPATAKHSQRVAQYATLLSKRVGLSDNEVWIAETGGLLHDIGKMGVPNAILQKSAPLDDTERKVLELSLQSSYDIVRSAFGEGPLAETVRTCRLRHSDTAHGNGTRAPVSGRIVAIADAFDAMISPAPYRPSLTREEALAELKRCAGTQFDADLVGEFCTVTGDNP
jgi:diguanylate cyclase (GGDEF)-like protein